MVNVKTLWSEPIDLRKLLVEAVELSLVLLVFLAEELVRLAGSVEDGVPLAVGDGQLLLVTTILGLVPILGDGKSEVGRWSGFGPGPSHSRCPLEPPAASTSAPASSPPTCPPPRRT